MKIIFLGGQGSGKSTQAKLIAQNLKIPIIEMGQLLRNKAEESGDEAAQVKRALESGNLVEDEVVVKTLSQRIEKSDCKDGYVLDGFPRNNAQLRGMPNDIDRVFFIKVSNNEAIRRLKNRKRSDDTEEALYRRLEIYHKDTEPLLDGFRNSKILEEFNGERPIEEIHEEILRRVNEFLKINN